MWKEAKRVLLIILGVLLVLLGIAGLALPFLQGFLFLAMGLILLMFSSRRFRNWAEVHTRRFPHVHNFIERTERWLEKYIDRPDKDEEDREAGR